MIATICVGHVFIKLLLKFNLEEGKQMKRLVANKTNAKQVKKFVGTTAYRFGTVATRVYRFAFGFGYQQKQAFGRVVCHTQNVVLSYRNWFLRDYCTHKSVREACTS